MPAEGAFRDGDGPDFQLIETMRWEPAAGFLRLDRHLARLYASARELGFAFDPQRIGDVLRDGIGGASPLRVRLTLAGNGDAQCAAQPYEPLPPGTVWRLGIAKTRLDSANRLLAHKTTRRETYVKARAEFTVPDADEVILLNERGEVCEGTITSIFVDRGDGTLLTPPLNCGLLAGVLRGEMIDGGKASEAVLTLDDLRTATTTFVGNSLRGLIPARLA